MDKYITAIKKHRDAKGNDRCWENDLELYKVLGEPALEHIMPSREEFTRQCREYIPDNDAGLRKSILEELFYILKYADSNDVTGENGFIFGQVQCLDNIKLLTTIGEYRVFVEKI